MVPTYTPSAASPGELLTRRDFAGRAGIVLAALGASALLENVPAALGQSGALPARTRATYRAVVEVFFPAGVPDDLSAVSRTVAEFEFDYLDAEAGYQEAVVVVLEVLETAAPGGRFSLLAHAERRAFVDARAGFQSEPLELGSTEALYGAIDAEAAQIRQAALLGPRGVAAATAAPGEDGPLVLAPTPLTGYVPDFDQEFVLGAEPPAVAPAAVPPLSEHQVRSLTIRAAIGLATERLGPRLDDLEDPGPRLDDLEGPGPGP